MTEPYDQAGDPSGDIPGALARDLRRLHEPGFSVPDEVDRAILAVGRRQLRARSRRLLVFRVATATAAAAAIAFAFLLWRENHQTDLSVDTSPVVALREDVDRNGRIDILDAFTLARHLESSQSLDRQWDMNGDGAVDRRDVDAVAMAAVRLKTG